MVWVITGQLEATSEGVTLTDCRVDVAFDRYLIDAPLYAQPPSGGAGERTTSATAMDAVLHRVNDERPTVETLDTRSIYPAQVSTRTNGAGRFDVQLPDREEIAGDTLRFTVSAPSGQTIGEEELTISRLRDPVRLRVRKVTSIVVKPTPVAELALFRVSGRVIERNGNRLPSTLQVLLFARRGAQGEETEASAPVLAAKADSSGYFTGMAPTDRFDRAAALVSGVPQEIPVPLEDGRIPRTVLLVCDIPHPTDSSTTAKGCECEDGVVPPRAPSQSDIENAPDVYSVDLGIGRCVQFNTPNRAIEEFDFYSVVRTTEPAIRGLTMDSSPDGDGRPHMMRMASTAYAASAIHEASPVESSAPPSSEGGTVALDHQPGTTTVLPPPPPISYPGTYGQPPPGVGAHDTGTYDIVHLRPVGLDSNRHVTFPFGRPPSRAELTATTPVDWDATPTFYEAATIAHGHLLHFKQVWYADGYSLGDLLYSLPLAPGQKKLISIVDWERREQAMRLEDTSATESLYSALSRDRDLGEVVSGMLTESARGGSKNTTAGVGVGTGHAGSGSYEGFNFGAVLGVSGGYGESNSSAWQDSSRDVAADSLQRLRDRTLQSASAVRGLRSSVVHTATQGEAVRATTEVVANHNHCHALTIQYFEVLRHLRVAHELADVQECLFIPMPMSEFDRAKALRWRETLEAYLKRPELLPAFDAARRVETNWTEVDTPVGQYADENVTWIAGELQITVHIPLPPFPPTPKPDPGQTMADAAGAVGEALNPTTGFLGGLFAVLTGGASLLVGGVVKATTQSARAVAESLLAQPSAQERYAQFQNDVMPGIAEGFVDQLELYALSGNKEVFLDSADFTLVSDYQPGAPLLVTFRCTLRTPMARKDISQIIVKSAHGLPSGCRVVVNSANLRYRTQGFEHTLVSDQRVNDDIDLPSINLSVEDLYKVSITKTTAGNGAALFTPLDSWELRRPRREDLRLSAQLVDHLNDNLEYYHGAIFWTMDPNRRYMLLDGYIAPNSGDRSVASVVENRLIGMAGNSLIMPVARGVHLDPRFKSDDPRVAIDLLAHYELESPVPPARVSLPTRGVFAEAVMGSCNACEEIDDSRYWRWGEEPIEEPPSIEPSSTATRRAEPTAATPTAFPTPMVSIQNAPAIPDPTGLRAALELLGKQSFADITGLAGTQANAAMAYSKALETAAEFGKEASKLAQQAGMLKALDKSMASIDKQEAAGKIKPEEAARLRTSALEKVVGGTDGSVKAADVTERLGLIKAAAQDGSINTPAAQGLTESVLRSYAVAGDKVVPDEQTAAAKKIDQLPPGSITSIETGTPPTTVKAGGGTAASAQLTLGEIERRFARTGPFSYGVISPLPGFDDTGNANRDYALWNFDVGSADLSRFDLALHDHGAFFGDWRDRGFSFDIVGLASVSGNTAFNTDLAFARALAVSNMSERRFQIPPARLNARQIGESWSVPPPIVLEVYGQKAMEIGLTDDATTALQMVWLAWNRRVEVHAVGEPWMDNTWDRIITFLGTAAAPVANNTERQRAIKLAKMLKDSDTDDLSVYSFANLQYDIRTWWTTPVTEYKPLLNEWLLNPSRWDRFSFAGHMREMLAKLLQPTASDAQLAARVVEMLRAMQETKGRVALYLQYQAGGSVDAIHAVYRRMASWMDEQTENEDSVYSVLK